jgi:uncharacterized damage-inducible protein DinB
LFLENQVLFRELEVEPFESQSDQANCPVSSARRYLQCPCPSPEEILMQDDVVALFAYDRWANTKVLGACRKLTAEQYGAELVPGVGGWSSVRSTIDHITLVTELHLRTLAGDPDDSPTPTEADLATVGGVDDAARLLERAYRRFEELRPTLTPEWLNTMLTLRGSDPRIGDYTFTLPRWAMLRHIVNHSTYHRGQVASKLKRFGIEQPNTDFFFWAIEQVPQEA